jgi:hypothetical protein
MLGAGVSNWRARKCVGDCFVVSVNNLGKAGILHLQDALVASQSLVHVNLSGNGIIGGGGQPTLDQICKDGQYKQVMDKSIQQACLILERVARDPPIKQGD